MIGAEQDWERVGAAVAADAALTPMVGGGALLLFDRDAQEPVYANAAGRALLGKAGANLPAATRQRLALLAGGLASRDGTRLERLRLTPGFSAVPVTCACRLIEVGGDTILAVAVPAAELRRLRIVVEAPSVQDIISVPAAATPAVAVASDAPAAPKRALVRFLWQSGSHGRFTSVSPDFAEAIGTDAAIELPGRSWAELIGPQIEDRSGGLIAKLAGAATWSGHAVLWRVAPGEGVRVELSGVPVLDANRAPAGFRGFGLARPQEREAFAEPDDGDAIEAAAEAAELTDETNREDQRAIVAAGPTSFVGLQDEPVENLADDTFAESVETEAVAAIEAEAELPGAPPVDEPLAEPATIAEDEEALAPAAENAPEPDAIAAGEDQPEAVETAPAPEDAPAAEQDEVPSPVASRPPTNIVPLRNGHLTAVRPVLEPSKPNLSSAERNAFREIAKVLGARIAGDGEIGPRLPPAAKLRLREAGFQDEAQRITEAAAALDRRSDAATGSPDRTEAVETAPEGMANLQTLDGTAAAAAETEVDTAEALAAASETAEVKGETLFPASETLVPASETLVPASDEALSVGRPRQPNSHADVLDRLPIAVLVNRGEEALYANRTLLNLLDYADLADLTAGGGVSRLIKEAERAEGGPAILVDRIGRLASVDVVLSQIAWLGESATLMAFRDAKGGELRAMTPDEAEDAEMAAEFAAEDAESAARVEALQLDVDIREARIGELVAMLDTATDGVVTIDERGRILSLNKTAEALFGYDQREVTGELFTLLFGPESHAPALDYLEGLKGGGVASVMNDGREVVGRVRQGGRIPLFMTMGQIADGAERRFCAVLRDITAWKKTEGELVEARKAAEKASAQKSDVLAKISHEIRTPLNAIIGFAEVMAEERFGPIANERYKEYLRDIHQSGGYVISLVNDLLDLAKIEAGKLDLDFVGVNLNEIALSAVSLLQPEAQRGRVVLRSGLAPKLPPVVADQRSIRQIVINLLSNAVKFTDAGGQVIVSTALGDQGEAILRVRDTGIGMNDSEIAMALEPFRQVPTTRRKGGTGLGLPLTKALVEANRAAMTITSVKKEGTLVEITFPPQRVLAG